jgi:hypothetical protein
LDYSKYFFRNEHFRIAETGIFGKMSISALRKPTLLEKWAFLHCGNRRFWKNGHFRIAETGASGKMGISALRK